MAQETKKAGSLSKRISFILTSSGSPVTGKVAANFTVIYKFPFAAPVTIDSGDLSDLTADTDSFTAGGFYESNGTTLPGFYTFDPPNDVFVAGEDYVDIFFKTADSDLCPVKVQLSTFELSDTADTTNTLPTRSQVASAADVATAVWATVLNGTKTAGNALLDVWRRIVGNTQNTDTDTKHQEFLNPDGTTGDSVDLDGDGNRTTGTL